MTDLSHDLHRRAARLRHELVTRLLADGVLVSPQWRTAFEQVPRHIFVPSFYRQTPTSQRLIDASNLDEWLAGVYDDALLLIRPDASSSSTVPSLMAVMLEALNPNEGDQVLEIGTGSGYNAALLCHRLEGEKVTTLDIDPDLVDEAQARLMEAGYQPTVVVGDGVAGWADNAPYDRLIATCAVEAIPPGWLAQVRHGGRLVVPVATGVAVLTVNGPEAATGRFLPEAAYFMPLRADNEIVDISEILTTIAESNAPTRSTDTGVDVWLGDGFQFLLALAVPGLRYLTNDPASGAAIFSHPDGSWAQLLDGQVTQGGSRNLWDAVEKAHRQWEDLDHPSRERFTIAVTGAQRYIRLDGTELTWQLQAV